MCNFLEVLLFNRTACEAADDSLVELIDYCYRKFVRLIEQCEKLPQGQSVMPCMSGDAKKYMSQSYADNINQQQKEIEFNCTMCCFSIIRFISDHVDTLPLPIIHQMMENNDIPCVLVPLMELKPWLRTNSKGEQEKFEDQKWQVIQPHERGRLTKVEAQLWLTIYNMLMTNESARKYELTTFRKQNLLRLRKYMNEILLD